MRKKKDKNNKEQKMRKWMDKGGATAERGYPVPTRGVHEQVTDKLFASKMWLWLIKASTSWYKNVYMSGSMPIPKRTSYWMKFTLLVDRPSPRNVLKKVLMGFFVTSWQPEVLAWSKVLDKPGCHRGIWPSRSNFKVKRSNKVIFQLSSKMIYSWYTFRSWWEKNA